MSEERALGLRSALSAEAVWELEDGQLGTPQQNHRMVRVGRDLCGSSSPTQPAAIEHEGLLRKNSLLC